MISSWTSKLTSEIYVYDLMTICSILLLIIGQNDINPKLFQPIVASVEKPCVCYVKIFYVVLK